MTPSLKVLKETVRKLINKRSFAALERLIQRTPKGDIVAIFRYLSPSERVKIFKILMEQNIQKASDIFYDLDDDLKIEIIRSLPEKDAVRILLTLSSGEIAKIIDKIPENIRNQVLGKLEEEERKEVEKYISYGDNSIVHLISDEYISVEEDKTVEDALNLIRTTPEDEDIEIIYIYVVDKDNKLRGVVSLRELLVAPPNAQLKDIMTRDVIFVKADTPREEVIELFKHHDLYLLPVVDDEKHIVGVIYIDDIIDAISEKTTEEVFKLAGSKEDELFYTQEPLKIVKLRIPWILASVFGELLTAFIISTFDMTLKKALSIVFFLPLVAAVNGNISSQSAIITIQAILTKRIEDNKREFLRILIRELKVAFFIALIVSFIVGFVSFLWLSNHILGLVVGIAILINILVAAFLGGSLPFILHLLKKDPTLATTPVMLTINDIVAITVYLTIATVFISYL